MARSKKLHFLRGRFFAFFAQAATGEVGPLEVAEAGPLELAVVARTLGVGFSSGGGLRERA